MLNLSLSFLIFKQRDLRKFYNIKGFGFTLESCIQLILISRTSLNFSILDGLNELPLDINSLE